MISNREENIYIQEYNVEQYKKEIRKFNIERLMYLELGERYHPTNDKNKINGESKQPDSRDKSIQP